MPKLILSGVAAAALISLAACGDSYTTDDTVMNDTAVDTAAITPSGATLPPTDPASIEAQRLGAAQTFADAASQASLVQIRTSEMALERATDPAVKAFAQMRIDQHTTVLENLRSIAMTAHLAALPETLDDFHMRRINDLDEDDGDEDFDADYMALQVDAHSDAIGLLRDYARDGEMPALASWASSTLATMEAGKTEAKSVKDAIAKKSG